MNFKICESIIKTLFANEVDTFCVCAGARNSPLVLALQNAKGIEALSFFEERSAAFFALGRARRDQKPVAVITTSGTAVAELLPAAIEATYSGVPLIFVTADRPKNYRHTGAPQTIVQPGIFGPYVEASFDLDSATEIVDLSTWTKKKPIHFNLSFSEPLIVGSPPELEFKSATKKSILSFEKVMQDQTKKTAMDLQLERPLVIVGSLNEGEQPAITNWLANFGAPIYAETISGLRGVASLESLLINHPDWVIPQAIGDGLIKSVFRIGGVPTLRFWRDLEEKFVDFPVVSVSDLEFSGLSRTSQHFNDYSSLLGIEATGRSQMTSQIIALDRTLSKKLLGLFEHFPKSEPALLFQLSQKIKGQDLYLGNSLPIREWDLVQPHDLAMGRVSANRGANGIDGQISSFLGWSRPNAVNWAVIGDLTALYDMAAFWASNFLPEIKTKLVVINNNGGMIFKRMFKNEAFLNRHSLGFEHLAKFWNWPFSRWTEIPFVIENNIENMNQNELIELIPDEQQTEDFWRDYQL